MIRRAATGLMILAMLTVGSPPSAAAPRGAVQEIEVVGTAFRITLADGRVLAQDELPGVRVALGDGSGSRRLIRIDAVERDRKDAAGETVLYELSERDAATNQWRNLCLPDPDGKRLGFPLSGAFTSEGRYVAAPGHLLITCTGGAEGKCIRFGYRPWRQAPDGTPLGDAYNACVRLVRADYAGDGRGTTRNGQPIDIYDAFSIQKSADAYEFEAGWNADGAVCVRHVRVNENATLEGVGASNPRLGGRVGDMCTEAFARYAGAILFVRSPP